MEKSKRLYWHIYYFLILLVFVFSSVGNTFYPGANRDFQILLMIYCYSYVLYCLFYKNKAFIVIVLLSGFLLSVFVAYISSRGHNFIEINTKYVCPVFLGYILCKRENRAFLKKILTVFLLLNFCSILYEIIAGTHLVKIADDSLGISTIIYRCGLFSNPKEGGIFIALCSIILYRFKEYWILPISFAFSILSGVRTSSFILFVPFMHTIFLYYKKKPIIASQIVLLVAISVYYFIVNYIDISLLNRFFDLLSNQDVGNQMRLSYIESHLDIAFKNYDFFDYLFGRYGFTTVYVGNGAESAWLDLLINIGLIGTLVYLVPLLLVFSLHRSWWIKCVYIMLFFAMCISRSGIGLSGGTMYWLIIYLELDNFGINKNGEEKN